LPNSFYPLTLFSFYIILIMFPFQFLYRATRFGFLTTLFQVVNPFGVVRFIDFFLADILCSMVKPLTDISFVFCYYFSGDFLKEEGIQVCKDVKTYYLAMIFLIFPYLFRFIQCLKKYYNQNKRAPFPHLIHAAKYFASIISGSYLSFLVFFYSGKIEWGALRIIWVVIQLISTTYNYAWDILVDWKFFQKGSSNLFLRNDLIVPRYKALYYLAIIFDFLLRYFWILTLFSFWSQGIVDEYAYFILSLLEMFRRGFWSYFRVENEVVSNIEDYRHFNFPVPTLGQANISKNLKKTLQTL